jgi:ATP-dependent Clp protease ATP-binding subunit ClpC
LGPTGVGKTELARTLAEALFGDEAAMVRIDMSEFQERHTVSRLVGPPPGYVGYEEAGQLTESVRRRPYSVLLLDEIEKAHPDVFSILLQILDDGRLTDSQGRTVDFKQTVIIMTSNMGAQRIQAHARRDESFEELKDDMMQILKNTLRPEFVNRIDEVIVFRSLGKEQIRTQKGSSTSSPYCYGERNVCVPGDPVSHHQSLRAEYTAASRSCAKSAIRARRS